MVVKAYQEKQRSIVTMLLVIVSVTAAPGPSIC